MVVLTPKPGVASALNHQLFEPHEKNNFLPFKETF